MSEITAREELYEIAGKLREADANEKQWKATKEKVRRPFFELITEVVEEEVPLAKETVTINLDELPGEPGEERLERWRLANYPEYRIVACNDQTQGGEVSILLEEDPSVRKFSFVFDGYKYGRTYSMTGGGTDVEALYKALAEESASPADPGLVALLRAITAKKVTVYELDEKAVRQALVDHPELVTFVQRFIDPGTPTVKLTPITKAKEEE